MNLAFVLLAEPRLPDGADVVRCFKNYASPDAKLTVDASGDAPKTEQEVLMLELDGKDQAFLALMPAPVPDGEADSGAQFSLSSIGSEWTLPPHAAHILVTVPMEENATSLEGLHRFTALLAAVIESSDAVGVYWGNASATHAPDFFLQVARDPDVAPRIMLWTGLSIAREEDGRLSLLSLGMRQLELPNLLLVVADSASGNAIETFFDLLTYVAKRGEPLPDGDTIGRTMDERFVVKYVPSPINEDEKVWRVEVA